MKKILGLDLGVGSVGWSLIEASEEGSPSSILAMGSRIVPLSTDDSNEFSSGNAISKNQKRTQKRTQRKGYDRYQLRRALLTEKLRQSGMLPDECLIKLPVLELWQLRANAATPGKKLDLKEIGRVLYHVNQKRGYRQARTDDSEDKSQREYVRMVNERYESLRQEGMTIGQHFACKLAENEIVTAKGKFYTYRIKEQVYPRAAYVEEFDRIMVAQRAFYPDVLTDAFVHEVRDEIIFYQRPLKSSKHLVSVCEFSAREYKTRDGKSVISGPKVAPRSSPLFQVCKIWESVNNLTLQNRQGQSYRFSREDRKKLFDYLDSHDKMNVSDLYKILGLSKKDGWWGGKAIGKGLQGNTTKSMLSRVLGGNPELLRFQLETVDSKQIDTETGEVLRVISSSFEKEPLYRLWHIVYSMREKDEMAGALKRQFGIDNPDTIEKLFAIDFARSGYGNKSSRFIREILPYLQNGMKYSDACAFIGVNHSNSITVAENAQRVLLPRLPQLQKNELRQPVIEKILNQMVAVVNALLDEYGSIDEIRVELARELKQSKDERNEAFLNNSKRERENKVIEERIREYGISPSRSRIQKYRLWEESNHLCFYCNQPVGASEFLSGSGVEIEHIIPRSLFFDDSFANKVCACRQCNAEKGNATAFDYMKSKSAEDFDDYVKRIQEFYEKKKISKTKRDRLLTSAADIPQDFIDRQLRQSQYISRKAVEMLKQVCRNVWTTSGSVTEFLRRVWGYNQILHDLNFPRYKAGGLTETIHYEHAGQKHDEERITGWTKRLDHRHHAIDALTIASTRQGYIQRLNTLNTSWDAMHAEMEKQSIQWQEKHSLLEDWAASRPHLSVDKVRDAVDGILVSFKAGKRVATRGKRYVYRNGKKILAQDGLLVPRGPLSEESVYGCIQAIEENIPVRKLFENPSLIFKPYIKALVEQRISECGGDWKRARASVSKSPIWLNEGQTVALEYATCWKQEYVMRYPLNSLKEKDVKFIVDRHIREIVQSRIDEMGEKEAFKTPLYADTERRILIRSVRLFTGLDAVEPVKYVDGVAVGFSKPGNNHHIGIYRDKEGNRFEHVVSFWHAVERKKYGIPIIIQDSDPVWEMLEGRELPQSFLKNLPPPGAKLELSMQQNEMFILGMEEDDFNDAMRERDMRKLNKCLYRVQKLGSMYYVFRYHAETMIDDSKPALEIHKFYRCQSLKALDSLNPHKVRISITGEILSHD